MIWFWRIADVFRPVFGYGSAAFRAWASTPFTPPNSGSVYRIRAASTNHIGLVANLPEQRTEIVDEYAS